MLQLEMYCASRFAKVSAFELILLAENTFIFKAL